MSRLIKHFLSSLFILLIGSLLLLNATACSNPGQETVMQGIAVVTGEVDKALTEPNELVFAGQVEDENGRWLNNRVIILFKNGEEVARTTSTLRESAFSGDGPMDGVFELRIANIYKLAETHEFFHYSSGARVEMRTIPGVVGNKYLGTWLEDLNPSDLRRVNVPSKQLEYALVVLPMPLDELPDTHRQGNLTFQNGMLVIKPEKTENGSVPETAVPIPAPETNIQLTILPSGNSGLVWDLQMTGYYGNRWDVWVRYLVGRVPGMSWEVFKEAVLVYNPHLQSDGFVFYPEKMYRLPIYQ